MKWVTYRSELGDRVGVVENGSIHALARGAELAELVGRGADGLREAGERALRSPDEVVPLAGATLRAPIPRPPAIRDCLCFLDHMRNCQEVMGTGRTLNDAWYEIPAFYFACPSTALGPHEPVPMAPGSRWWDFELEIAAVLGTGGRDLTPDEAERAIVGYTIYNDWSARDLQLRESPLAIGQAKGKDSATTLGPYLVTADELEPYRRDGRLALEVEATVNGERVGGGRTDAMDWTFGEVISYASRGVDLLPGEVFGSGTVPSCCLIEHFSPGDPASFRGWLQPGDVVSLRVDGLGETRQTVVATPDPHPIPARHNPDAVPRRKRVNPARSPRVPYTKGLHEIGPDVWAWLLPDGGYGWSNAGLVAGAGASLLVDTLFDLRLTGEMLAAMKPVTDRHPLTHAVLTHANGDHTHGSQLLGDTVRVVAAADTAHQMHTEIAPDMLAAVRVADLGPVLTPFLRERFGPFDFDGIRLRLPDVTFDRELTLDVGGREVRVLNLGPAHTSADSVVHIPDAGVLFAGDLLFVGCTPIVWDGPIANWIAACDTMLALDVPTIVPGHGPVTDAEGVREVRGYLTHVVEQADAAHAKGLTFREAAEVVDLAEYAEWLDAERIVVNLYRRYRELEPGMTALAQPELLALMAEWEAAR
ncbi:fumarylacetoacetate hydrolase family protein [Amycolatopsis albispora]|uniref:2-hydroxyhepta-2,4-diene-1,7-dioate isomerase n=1 Tax=Amycolatopsis albispora TaxID=1804986 RepID=A0A344L019_9PSEU|nr:fumarylacetoacetate hydrolase family protein [Amycolatopsis albispora]AXB41393.1 2-hydroxyhepta-2,4-diene-1,7-dioate isomerase [Amycolatopsis albispora]